MVTMRAHLLYTTVTKAYKRCKSGGGRTVERFVCYHGGPPRRVRVWRAFALMSLGAVARREEPFSIHGNQSHISVFLHIVMNMTQ